jgi:CheY-like chemotaxis protein
MPRILSLEYEPLIGEMLCAILQEAGYDVQATANVHEALLILRTQSIDLLTLGLGTRELPPPPSIRRILPSALVRHDWPVPPMNGEEFLRLLKDDATLHPIPVLLISGFSRDTCAQFLQEFGLDIDRDVDGCIQKGHEPGMRELLDTVETVLRKCGKPLPAEELRRCARERLRRST